jgi:REP element-mobilizing transposase RayT
LHVAGGFYHVTLRGNHQEDLFAAPEDRKVLNDIVAEALTVHGARCHAFCWMTNHLHAFMQVGNAPLGPLVQRIAVRYARYRHKQLGIKGHLFERRHGAWLVQTDLYFVTLLRYIHLNPVNARMVESAAEYAWSSHRGYLGLEAIPWLTTDFGLSMFGKTEDIARRHYDIMVRGDLYASELSVFEQANPKDPRVLGTDEFIESLKKPKWRPRSRLTLDELIEQVSKQERVSVEAVLSTSKLPELSCARAEIARRAIDERIASVREVARTLNRCPTGIGRLVRRHRE